VNKVPEHLLDVVTVGNAFEIVWRKVPDQSIDMIFCDPVWQNVNDYAWVGNIARRVLKVGGNCIVQSCSEYLFDHERAMSDPGLVRYPVLIETLTGLRTFWKYRVQQAYKPYLWYARVQADKPKARAGSMVPDAYKAGPITKHQHPWQDNLAFFAYYIAKLTDPGDVVLDPFCGTGTVAAACTMLGRHFVTCEIEESTAQTARDNLKQCDVMLPELAALEPVSAPVLTRAQKQKALAEQLGLL